MSKDIKDLQSKILYLDWKKIELSLNTDLEKKQKLSDEVELVLSILKK